MVRPITNCSAIIFIAWRSATRTTRSPARATTLSYQAAGSRVLAESICVSLPVSMSPQVDALTSIDGLCPRCLCQSPRDSLSRISRSAVAASGMRSNASATHMSRTPSWVARSYCCRNDSMPTLLEWCERTAPTHARARASTRVAASAPRAASGSSCATAWTSSARNAARIASAAGRSGSMGRAMLQARATIGTDQGSGHAIPCSGNAWSATRTCANPAAANSRSSAGRENRRISSVVPGPPWKTRSS